LFKTHLDILKYLSHSQFMCFSNFTSNCTRFFTIANLANMIGFLFNYHVVSY